MGRGDWREEASAVPPLLDPGADDGSECLPEVDVEDGVDDGVHEPGHSHPRLQGKGQEGKRKGERVHVAEPGGEEEGDEADLAGLHAHLDADGVLDVEREEGEPAEEEDASRRGRRQSGREGKEGRR